MSCKDISIKKVIIKPGCITCGACEFIAPQVFQVTDVSHVLEDAPLATHADAIIQAEQACPVNVIEYEQ